MWEVARIGAAVEEAADVGQGGCLPRDRPWEPEAQPLLLSPSCILYLQSFDYITIHATNKTEKI